MPTRYQALTQERADLVRQNSALSPADRASTVEESAAVDANLERLDAIALELSREERRREHERSVGTLTPNSTASGTVEDYMTVRRDVATGSLVDGAGRPIAKNVNGFPRLIPAASNLAMTGFESGRDRASLKPWGTDTGAPFGEYLQAVHRARMGIADDPRLAYMGVAQGAGEATPADGGFAVGLDIQNTIMELMHDVGRILSLVPKIPIGANSNGISMLAIKETSRATGSRFGAVQGYWLDEGTAPTATRPKYRKIELRLVKLAALGYSTDELLADAVALEAVMTRAFAEELAFLTEDSIINGLGAGQPLGILASPALVSVAKESGQAAATIVTTNLSKMWARLLPQYQGSAVWLINVDCDPQLDELTLPAGTAGLQPRFVNYSNEGILQIKGRPVIEVEYCQTVGTKGDIILAAFDQYALIDKGGVQQASSMHVAFTTDEMAFRATYRVNGQPKMESPITPFKGTSTLSAFVSLDTRA